MSYYQDEYEWNKEQAFFAFVDEYVEKNAKDWTLFRNQQRAVFEVMEDWRLAVISGCKKELQELQECVRLRKFSRAKELYARIAELYYTAMAEEEARKIWNGETDEPYYPEYQQY